MAQGRIQTVCPACGQRNRLPAERLDAGGRCGACHQPLFQGRLLELDDASFQRHLSGEELPVVVDFWAVWCGPCKAMAPTFEAAAAEMEPMARFAKVNVDQAQATARRFAIRSIPTLMIFLQGHPIATQAGAMSAKQLRAWLLQRLPEPGADGDVAMGRAS